MWILTKAPLRAFWEKHPDAEGWLQAWHKDTERAQWDEPNDIRADYNSVSFVANDRVVFNVCGNKYRLIVHVLYEAKRVYVRFVGTHAEYDAVNATEV